MYVHLTEVKLHVEYAKEQAVYHHTYAFHFMHPAAVRTNIAQKSHYRPGTGNHHSSHF